MRFYATIAAIVAAALFGLTTIFGSWYTIDQGERGVVLRNGALIGTAEPGLGFKLPFIDNVVEISTQSQKRTYDAGNGTGLAAYSKDQQSAVIRLSANYRADPTAVAHIYERYGSLDAAITRLVDPQVYEEVKNVFGQFNAATAVQERARLNAEIQEAIRIGVPLDSGIIIESVQIENIDFSENYEASIEARMLAEVEVQKRTQELAQQQVQAQITVTQAQAQADAVLAAAKAQADATRLAGEAEADAIRAKGDALADNPSLVALITAEKWDGVLPLQIVPGSAVPFLNLSTPATR